MNSVASVARVSIWAWPLHSQIRPQSLLMPIPPAGKGECSRSLRGMRCTSRVGAGPQKIGAPTGLNWRDSALGYFSPARFGIAVRRMVTVGDGALLVVGEPE